MNDSLDWLQGWILCEPNLDSVLHVDRAVLSPNPQCVFEAVQLALIDLVGGSSRTLDVIMFELVWNGKAKCWIL